MVCAIGTVLKYFKIADKTAFGIKPIITPNAVPDNTLLTKIFAVIFSCACVSI